MTEEKDNIQDSIDFESLADVLTGRARVVQKETLKEEEIDEQKQEEVKEEPRLFPDIWAKAGFKLEKEYKEDTDGFAEAIVDATKYGRETYERELQEEYSDVYEALQHKRNGGDIRDILEAPVYFSSLEFKEEDENFQAAVLAEYYAFKDIDEELAKEAIEKAKDKGVLKDLSKKALGELQAVEKKAKAEVIARQSEIKKKEDEYKASLSKITQEKLTKGSFNAGDLEIIIPEADRKSLQEHIGSRVIKNEKGTYDIRIPFTPEALDNLLMVEYFRLKGGDLTKVLIRRKETIEAKKLVATQTQTNKTGEDSKGIDFEQFRKYQQQIIRK